jgi:pimeloyl-ACP methyl ester carboxylesterase
MRSGSCKAPVSVLRYLIGSPAASEAPLPHQAELAWWYQLYFATDRGQAGAIVIRNYRWRHGLAAGEPQYDDLERQLAGLPAIAVPAIALEGDANGTPHPDASACASKFPGKYAHRVIDGGVGHNPLQEAPRAFAEAIVDVDS